jgi:hypothetical protein
MIVKAFRPVKIGDRVILPDTEFEASADVVKRLQEGGAGITVIAPDLPEPETDEPVETPKPKPKKK